MLSSEVTGENLTKFRSLKPIFPDCSNDEITAALRSSKWDIGAATEKLFPKDPSHEVERKEDKDEEVHKPTEQSSVKDSQNAPKKKTSSHKTKQTNTPVSDGTPNSVVDGTPPPLTDVPLNAIFKPTDHQIIVLLNRKISGLPIVGDMVRRVAVYNNTPNFLVRKLHQYLDNGIPHYLALSAPKLINEKKIRDDYLSGGVLRQRRYRAVKDKDGKILGYWAAHGERWMITDEKEEVVGSKLLFTFNDGSLKDRKKGMRKSVWCMEEYRVERERKTERTAAELKYTICKLYKDFNTSHVDAFKESELQRERATKLQNDIYTLLRRKGLSYKRVNLFEENANKEDVMLADMLNCSTRSLLPPKFEEELIDDCQRSRHEIEVESVRVRKSKPRKTPKSWTFMEEDENKLAGLAKGVSKETLKSWQNLKWMEEDENKWARSAKDFVTSEETQAFNSAIRWKNYDITKEFMAILLSINCLGWLSEEHMNTWVYYLMKHYRRELIMDGKEARWTILPTDFDIYMVPRKTVNVPLENGITESIMVSDDENDRELVVERDDTGGYEPDPDWPKLWDVDTVYMPLHSHDHWVLVELHLVDFTVKVHNSMPGHQMTNIENHIKKWEKRLPLYLNKIGFWEKKQTSPQDLKINVIEDNSAPRQENGNDCGVMVCRVLEKIVKGDPLVDKDKTELQIGNKYRKYMADTIYSRRC